MRSLFDAETRADIERRLNRIGPDSSRKFGSMTPNQMICHMSDHLSVALGRLQSTPARGFLATGTGQWLGICLLPWPKGRTPSPPEQLTTSPGEFEADRRRLKELIEEFSARGPQGQFGPHSVFGHLSAERWGQLAAKHFEHHLRQFGV